MVTLLLLVVPGLLFVGIAVSLERVGKKHVVPMLGASLCLALTCFSANAQEVVHTRVGQVTAVNAKDKSLTLRVADGSTIVFHEVTSPEPAMSFAKSVREKTKPIEGFSGVGSNVAVFYFGFDRPTAVAIKDFGADPVKRTIGTVEGFDHHQHTLSLKTEMPDPQKIVLTDDTIVDTDDGVVKLSDYKPSKGAHLRCVTKPQSETALLVTPQ